MRPRQAGWRSGRFTAPARPVVPQPAAAPQPGRVTQAAQPARLKTAGPYASGTIAELIKNGNWSLSFIGVLCYVFAAVTYALPIVLPSIVIAILGLAFERTRITIPAFLIVFALYVAWAAAGMSSSIQAKQTTDQVVVLLKVLLIVFVIVNVSRDSWRVRMFSIFFLACFAAYPARGTLFNYFISGYTMFGRALWNFIYGNSNDLAALTFFPMSLAIATFLTEPPGWIKRAALVGLGVLPLIVLLTQSRGAMIAMVVSGILFYIVYAKGKRVKSLAWAVAVSILVIPFVPQSAWNRFSGLRWLGSTETVAYADPEGSAEARYNIWRIARVIISENPVSGIGLGNYPLANAMTAPRVGVPDAALGFRDTHSTYLNVAAETGIPGLALFMTMIAMVAIPAELVRRRAKGTPRAAQLLALELGLCAYMLAGIFGSFGKLSFLYIQLATIWLVTDLTKLELMSGASAAPNGVAREPAVRRRR
jgi:O-antigen ligase